MGKNEFDGKWKIIEMDQWDQEYIDMLEPGYIEFEGGKSGSFHFGCIYANIDYRINDGSGKATFSFQGDDEGQAINGRGWAKIKDDNLLGHIFFHDGMDSKFSAKFIGSEIR